MSIYKEFGYVQIALIESEKFCKEKNVTFRLILENNCSFIPQQKPPNYSHSEVLKAIEKNKLKKV